MGGLTICGVHDVVEVVDGEAAIVTWFACNTAQSVVAFAARFVFALSGKETCCEGVRLRTFSEAKILHTFVEEQEESDRASTEKQVSSVKLEDIGMQRCTGKIKPRNLCWLVTQNVEGHDTSQRVCEKVHTATFLKLGVILAP